jgi:ATP-dependent Clp protease, protease subunit
VAYDPFGVQRRAKKKGTRAALPALGAEEKLRGISATAARYLSTKVTASGDNFDEEDSATWGVAEIFLYGEIGEWGIDATSFRYAVFSALSEVYNSDGPGMAKLRVRIHSLGGDPWHAVAIYNTLLALSVPVEVVVDGVCASAASVIAMAGNPVVMPSNTFMMIHLPATFAWGDENDIDRAMRMLDVTKQSMIECYAKKCGQSKTAVAEMMADETWLIAADCVALGFADKVVDSVPIAALAGVDRYPKAPLDVVTALSGTTMPPITGQPKETPDMTDKTTAADATAPVAESPEAIEARVRATIQARASQIAALCRLAGREDLAAGFITSEKSEAEVQAELLALPPKAQVELRGNVPAFAESGIDVEAALNPIKVYADYNRRRPKFHRAPAGK